MSVVVQTDGEAAFGLSGDALRHLVTFRGRQTPPQREEPRHVGPHVVTSCLSSHTAAGTDNFSKATTYPTFPTPSSRRGNTLRRQYPLEDDMLKDKGVSR